MSRSILLALALAGFSLPAIAQAPPAAPGGAPRPAALRLNGVVAAVSADSMTVKAADGTATTLPLARTWTAVTVRPVDIDSIKPGSFVATANLQMPNGDGKSIELRLFEPGNKGGEGSRPMAQPGQVMTNATVTAITKGPNGRELDVAYPGGTRHIIVPPDVQVMGTLPLDRATVKAGMTVTANTAAGDDGVVRITRVSVAAPKP